MGLGCFPFDCETYLTQSDSHTHLSGILSLIRVGNLSTPHLFSALPPVNIFEASPKAISGRTSYIRVRLEFLRYPQVITDYFNRRVFGPPQRFTAASTCSWIGHPVSGLRRDTIRSLQTRFRFGSETLSLNLASHRNSPARSTKSTTSHACGAMSACKHTVSGSFSLPSRGSFHLSLTVLFRYRSPSRI